MSRIKFDNEHLKFLSKFQSITRVVPKDCIDEKERLLFIVPEVLLTKAVGKNGVNARALEKAFNRKIKIVGFNPNVLRFVKNLIYPSKPEDIKQEDGIIYLKAADSATRAQMIGRSGANLRQYENIVNRYFKDIKEIKVIK